MCICVVLHIVIPFEQLCGGQFFVFIIIIVVIFVRVFTDFQATPEPDGSFVRLVYVLTHGRFLGFHQFYFVQTRVDAEWLDLLTKQPLPF
ncbi:MAG: hypothetical protein AAFY76_21605 [Cyanobacteria bacterium J06649_11]